MALVVLGSPGGSPGVSTTSLGLTVTWPVERRVLLAELDLAGGALLAGYLRGWAPGDRGLLSWGVAAGQGPQAAAEALWSQLIDLDGGGQRRLALPGLADPLQAASLDHAWSTLAAALAGAGMDVVADIGRVGPGSPLPVITAADLVVLVAAPTLRGLAAARPRVSALRELLEIPGGEPGRLGVALAGQGPYTDRDVAGELGTPVWGRMPHDPRAAGVLSDGTEPRRGFGTSELMRTLGDVGRQLRERADRPGGSEAANPDEDRPVWPANPRQQHQQGVSR